MNIIHPGKQLVQGSEQSGRLVRLAKEETIPFIPAYDLLEEQERLPSAQDIVAIGLSLWLLVGSLEQDSSNWQVQSRSEAISNRL